jgi:hypothetical protein
MDECFALSIMHSFIWMQGMYVKPKGKKQNKIAALQTHFPDNSVQS